MKSIE